MITKEEYYFSNKTNEIFEALAKEGLYPIVELQKRLKEEGFSNSKISIYHHEKKGNILEPTERRLVRGKMWRLYSKERIEEIIENLKSKPLQKRIIG